MAKLLTEVKIGGTDIATYLKGYKVESTWGDYIKKATITASKKIFDTLTITEGDTVTIKRGFTMSTDQFIFEGMITKIIRYGGIITFECKDMLYEAYKANITASYDINIDPAAGVLSEIFKDIINNYTSLTADDTSVTNSGTVNVIEKLVFKNEDVYTAIKKIADILNYYIYYSPDDGKVHFHPKGLTIYGTTLKVGSASGNNILNKPKWKSDTTNLINKVIVHGASQIDNRTEYFNGDGFTKTFALANTPEDTKVYVDGVLKTRGIEDASSSYDYTVDAENKTITFVTAPPSGSNNIEVNYGVNIPIPVIVKNTTSIATYGGPDKTPNETALFEKDIKTVADAEKRGRAYIDKYSTPFVSTELRLKDIIDIDIGYQVDIEDNINNKILSLMVNKLTQTYPYNGDVIAVGDKELRLEDWSVDVAKKIREIQVELSKNQDILVQIVDLGMTLSFRRKSFKIEKRSLGTSAIYGSPTNGIYGTATYGISGASSWSTVYEVTY